MAGQRIRLAGHDRAAVGMRDPLRPRRPADDVGDGVQGEVDDLARRCSWGEAPACGRRAPDFSRRTSGRCWRQMASASDLRMATSVAENVSGGKPAGQGGPVAFHRIPREVCRGSVRFQTNPGRGRMPVARRPEPVSPRPKISAGSPAGVVTFVLTSSDCHRLCCILCREERPSSRCWCDPGSFEGT